MQAKKSSTMIAAEAEADNTAVFAANIGMAPRTGHGDIAI